MYLRGAALRVFVVAVGATTLFVAQFAGQQPNNSQNTAELTQQDTPLIFSTATNLVLVPVVVRDVQGHAIGTLTRDNFQLFDKSKPVTISKFSVEKVDAPPILPDTSVQADENGNPVEKSPNAPGGKPVASHFVMWLFDDTHLSSGDLAQTREAAKKILKESFEPGTRAAIYTTSNHESLDFTDDVNKLDATLDRIKPWPTIPTDNAVKPCPDAPYAIADAALNRNDPQALLAIQTNFLSCPETQGMMAAAGFGATDPQTIKAGVTAADVGTYLKSATGALLRMELIKTVEVDFQDTRNTLIVLKGLVRRMSAMPGSRTIVLISPGFYLVDDHRLDEMDLINSAIRSNVVISTLDARGLWTAIPGASADATPGATDPATQSTRLQYEQSAKLANQNILEELAVDTGGAFFRDDNDFYGGLKLVATQPENIYVLGFAPQNLKFDGSYHTLKVTLINVGKQQIQARRGYFERQHLENAAEEAKEEIKDTFFSRDEIRELPVELNTQFFKTSEVNARLSLLTRIDAKHLRYRKDGGRNNDTLTVVGGVFDQNGIFVAGTQKVVNLNLKDQTLDALPTSGITVKTNLDVPRGEYVVRLVVRDSEGQVMSALTSAVNIP